MLGEEIFRCNRRLHDYVLMSNHFHLAIETPEANLAKGMHRLQGGHSGSTGGTVARDMFQGRYKSLITEKESYLLELSRYVVLNPVRAKMVAGAGAPAGLATCGTADLAIGATDRPVAARPRVRPQALDPGA